MKNLFRLVFCMALLFGSASLCSVALAQEVADRAEYQEADEYTCIGTVTAKDAALKTITIKHGAVEDVKWAAKETTFIFLDVEEFDDADVGDTVSVDFYIAKTGTPVITVMVDRDSDDDDE